MNSLVYAGALLTLALAYLVALVIDLRNRVHDLEDKLKQREEDSADA